jgi:hypothetical protein
LLPLKKNDIKNKENEDMEKKGFPIEGGVGDDWIA